MNQQKIAGWTAFAYWIEARNAQDIASIADPTPHPNDPRIISKLPGDPRAMRGVPIIARGIGGTSPHSNPATASAHEIDRWLKTRATSELSRNGLEAHKRGHTTITARVARHPRELRPGPCIEATPPTDQDLEAAASAAAKGSPETRPVSRADIRARTHGRCYLCLRPLARRWHIDHVIPLYYGGPHILENLLPAHPSCNTEKGALIVSIDVETGQPILHFPVRQTQQVA